VILESIILIGMADNTLDNTGDAALHRCAVDPDLTSLARGPPL